MTDLKINLQLSARNVNPYLGISGIKKSPRNQQIYVTSSGVTTFDELIGSGLIVGSSVLIESDFTDRYAIQFAKHFIAEGVAWQQNTLLITDFSADHLMKKLPAPILRTNTTESSKSSETNEDMVIAWRYQGLSSAENQLQSRDTKLGHRFDLAKKMTVSEEYLQKHYCAISLQQYNSMQSSEFCNHLLKSIDQCLTEHRSSLSPDADGQSSRPSGRREITRIVLSGLYPTYIDDTTILKQFLLRLSHRMRNALAIAYIVLPPCAFPDDMDLAWMRYQCDLSFKLVAFSSRLADSNPLYGEYKGLLNIDHLPAAVNGLEPSARPDTVNLAFKIKQRQFIVEPLFLPPDFSETVNRSTQLEALQSSKIAGGKSTVSSIDF